MADGPSLKSPIRIIGIGNDYRHDDAAGLIVARRLKEQALDPLTIIEQSGEGAALMESWKNAEAVILIDAVHSGAKPGTIFCFDAIAQPLPTQLFHYSTHAFSLAEAVEMARALNQLPPRLIVYGIEGKNFTSGIGLSSEVNEAAQAVVARVLLEVQPQVLFLKTENSPAVFS